MNRNSFFSLVVGLLFSLGLGISGMTQPQKVIGFLDVLGQWDPSLMFVMVGAISVHFVAYRLIRRRSSPQFSPQWHIPENSKITSQLTLGAILFGMGWGLAGYCPGPAVTSLATFQVRPLLLVSGMIFGMFLYQKFNQIQLES